ncbi:HmcD domain-containing protein, partial [Campylobacter upsaliensis]|nr:HmcD domain-containing protein [Campylobacter upsaliensis]
MGVNGDLNVWNDTKQLYLNQTFIYTLTPSFDLLISGGGNYARQEYNNIISGAFTSKNTLNFDSLWVGFIYTGESIADFVPQIKFQTAIIQREKTVLQTKNFYLKSQNIEANLRGYSDPVVYSIYTGFAYNAQRKFKIAKIEYGNSIYFGGNLSIVLSPKITLDLGAEQRFQT